MRRTHRRRICRGEAFVEQLINQLDRRCPAAELPRPGAHRGQQSQLLVDVLDVATQGADPGQYTSIADVATAVACGPGNS